MKVNALAVNQPNGKLKPFTYELGELGSEDIDVKVLYCGICHSDMSMMNNEWGLTQYPIVPGHEIVGEVLGVGSSVKNIKVGDNVGIGWLSSSCMSCSECMSGDHNLCASGEGTIIGRHGGFSEYVRSHWSWAIPIPDGMDLSKTGPLLCGGITVFSPMYLSNIKPTDSVGVIGIGGLGHLAIKFLKHWGCEVIAFSSNSSKEAEILEMGASKVINSKDSKQLEMVSGKLKFILNTTNVSLDWNSYLSALSPKGKLHTVGAVLEPMEIPAFSLIMGDKSVGGSPIGSPELIRLMLEFCKRHNIYPDVEEFPMNMANEAVEHLKEGKARYRVVLKA
ncbi:NAD(P)-dependent alcohol dehydrogenase [Flavobacteriaceae bacterium]|nr:NAD(P)-dependent alcohol dehydrogenase [Flavobacteriaceae bacterium]MDC1273962.1 NAD(P)-dependent alcohol dehydrogenase [Flavobacteriaceae bacterium]